MYCSKGSMPCRTNSLRLNVRYCNDNHYVNAFKMLQSKPLRDSIIVNDRNKEPQNGIYYPASSIGFALPFSQAPRADDWLYLSGAIGNRPGTLALIEGGLPDRRLRRWTILQTCCEPAAFGFRHHCRVDDYACGHGQVGGIQSTSNT